MFSIWNRIPSDKQLSKLDQRPAYTPDMFALEQSENQWLFEYGSDCHGQRYVNCVTDERMCMWQRNYIQGTPPVVLKTSAFPQASRARIKGSLQLMSTKKLVELDEYVANGLHFERKRVKLVMPAKNNNNDLVNVHAWMYFGKNSHWEELLNWDFSFFKGRTGAQFSVAKTDEDYKRPWMHKYYVHKRGEAVSKIIKCFIGLGGNGEDKSSEGGPATVPDVPVK